VRIAELSSRSGTSIPSIKYYLREGLLPPGAATGRNRADYGPEHLHRLRLVRALINVGGLSVAAARDVLAAVDTADLPSHAMLGVAHCSVVRPAGRDPDDPAWQQARAEIVAAVRRRGWYVHDASPGFDNAADAVAAYHELGQEDLLSTVEAYLGAAEQVAASEVDAIVARGEPGRMVEGVITGTIIGEALFNALRRLAREDASARRLLTDEERSALDPAAPTYLGLRSLVPRLGSPHG
jgi:DNA-binding transcriptional MerR regulator